MSAYGAWDSSRIGGGGYAQQVVLCPSDARRVYAYTDIGGIARSDDGGASWRLLHGALPPETGANEIRGLLADPRDANRLVAAAGSVWGEPLGLYRSEDGGGTWALALRAVFLGNGPRRWEGAVLARNAARPDELLAASAGTGLWRSGDGGRTWSSVGMEGLYPSDLKWDRRGGRVWLCAHVTTVHGAVFAGGFHRSEDGGASWARLADLAPDELVVDPVDPAAVIGIFGAERIRRSRDGGETWEDYHEGLPEGGPGADTISERRFQALAAGPDFVLAGSSRGTVWRRAYRAARWERVEPRAVEEGSWWGRYEGRPGEWRHFGAGLSSLLVDPLEPARWWRSDWYGIYRSTDAGTIWRLVIDGLEGTYVHALARDAADGRIVHAGLADVGYFRSTDGGATFAQVLLPGGGNTIRSLATTGRDPRRLYAAGSLGYDSGSNAIWRTDDAGASWARVGGDGLPDPGAHACVSVAAAWWNAEEAFGAFSGPVEPGGGGVYWTADGGAHWVWWGDGLGGAMRCFLDAPFTARGVELAAGRTGAVLAASRLAGQVWRADRPGARWEAVRVPGVVGPSMVCRDPHRDGVFYLAANPGGLWASADDGRTWRRLLDRPVATATADEAEPGRLAAGGPDGLWLSRDDGTTWTPAADGLPNRRNPVAAFASGGILAGTTGNGVFRSAL